MRRPRRFECYPLPPVVADATTVRAQLADLDRKLATIRQPAHRGPLLLVAAAAVESARAASIDHLVRMTEESSAAWVTARDAATEAYVAAWGEYADACAAATIARGLSDRARTRGAA